MTIEKQEYYKSQKDREFTIEKITYEKGTVVVSGPFDAKKLCCKNRKIIQDIKIKPAPSPPPPTTTEPKPKASTPHCVCYSKPPVMCGCPTWLLYTCCWPYPSLAVSYSTVLLCEENPNYSACTVM
ncbi:hypothetical protein E2562_014983 [Oryza meyeriana var. granulata]|uniref:Uncharacterized protein n=1 Tax=Oryza meyeriana var. granulata TaxID=110450 RepID=A0A6G1EJI7_9ORYZ|nr:hypothetical protein E2562_014983 [Oryza meyeriana var. granulata]